MLVNGGSNVVEGEGSLKQSTFMCRFLWIVLVPKCLGAEVSREPNRAVLISDSVALSSQQDTTRWFICSVPSCNVGVLELDLEFSGNHSNEYRGYTNGTCSIEQADSVVK